MKTLGVYTRDFSLYHDLLKVLKRRGVAYISLSSLQHIPSGVAVILTSHNELHDIKTQKVIPVDAYDTLDHAVDLALQMLIGKDLYSKVSIGIDPGDCTGVAIVGDDILLQKTTVDEPRFVLPLIIRFLREYPALETIIRIGHGSPLIRNRIINALIPLGRPIEIVDETKTTTAHPTKRTEKDSQSAAAIALLTGGKVDRRLPLEPTKGEVRDVQRHSRQLTEGKYSISEKTALRVLHGNISLKEAVEIEKPGKKPKRL
jgi:hypothetical protein